jgi:hypothetical protein
MMNGPFIEATEQLTAYYMIDCESPERARSPNAYLISTSQGLRYGRSKIRSAWETRDPPRRDAAPMDSMR